MELELGYGAVSSADVSSGDRSRLLVGTGDRVVLVYDLEREVVIYKFEGFDSTPTTLRFTKDNNVAIVGLENGDLYKLVLSKNERTKFGSHTEKITAIAVSDDNLFIATGSKDGAVVVWELSTGNEISRFYENRQSITTLSFAHKGAILAAGDTEGRVALFLFLAGQYIRSIIHTRAVTSISFHPTAKFMAVAALDKTVRFWDIETFHAGGRNVEKLFNYRFTMFMPDEEPNSPLIAFSEFAIQVFDHTDSNREMTREDVDLFPIMCVGYNDTDKSFIVVCEKNSQTIIIRRFYYDNIMHKSFDTVMKILGRPTQEDATMAALSYKETEKAGSELLRIKEMQMMRSNGTTEKSCSSPKSAKSIENKTLKNTEKVPITNTNEMEIPKDMVPVYNKETNNNIKDDDPNNILFTSCVTNTMLHNKLNDIIHYPVTPIENEQYKVYDVNPTSENYKPPQAICNSPVVEIDLNNSVAEGLGKELTDLKPGPINNNNNNQNVQIPYKNNKYSSENNNRMMPEKTQYLFPDTMVFNTKDQENQNTPKQTLDSPEQEGQEVELAVYHRATNRYINNPELKNPKVASSIAKLEKQEVEGIMDVHDLMNYVCLHHNETTNVLRERVTVLNAIADSYSKNKMEEVIELAAESSDDVIICDFLQKFDVKTAGIKLEQGVLLVQILEPIIEKGKEPQCAIAVTAFLDIAKAFYTVILRTISAHEGSYFLMNGDIEFEERYKKCVAARDVFVKAKESLYVLLEKNVTPKTKNSVLDTLSKLETFGF